VGLRRPNVCCAEIDQKIKTQGVERIRPLLPQNGEQQRVNYIWCSLFERKAPQKLQCVLDPTPRHQAFGTAKCWS